MDLKKVYQTLDELQIDKSKLIKPKTDLPLLFHFGRTGNTVSYFGANISPNDMQETIYKMPALASFIHSFFIKIEEDENGNKQLIFLLELNENMHYEASATFNVDFIEQLKLINQDFKEAIKMVPAAMFPNVILVKYKTNVFAENDIRIKLKYS